ncbi:MAG: leucyl/phenylalanyl-tRNA--protein transferase [Planctomycetes bacterium]|nr:leucyl/phenylalanyl-tRNA--protein transferase [Planctomycetota bacterium]
MARVVEQDPAVIPRDLQPDRLLSAYASGIFPMAMEDDELGWFAPDPRAIIPLDAFRVTRSLRQVCRKPVFDITVDKSFEAVIAACAQRDEETWISAEIVDAYTELHRLGFAHSVESWCAGELVGGLYGVALRGVFCGESMFHRQTDASKVAMVYLVERLRERGYQLLDVQFMTDHLRRFGAVEIPRSEYEKRLSKALEVEVTFTD